MKQSQLVVSMLLLAAMVFGITFALNYLGNSGGPGSVLPPIGPLNGPRGELTFGMQKWTPAQGIPPNETEMGKNGYHDFWFVNRDDRPVALGLEKKDCSCSEVFIHLIGDEWKPRRAALLAGQVAGMGFGCLSGLTLTMAAEADPKLLELQSVGATGQLSSPGESIRVPAQKAGWVRLKWIGPQKSQDPHATVLGATLWMVQKDGPTARLEVAVHYLDTYTIATSDREQKLGDISPGNLPLHRSIMCWSSTRPSLPLKADLLTLRGGPKSDPFAVGAAVPLSVEETRMLAAELSNTPESGRIQCGYRIPVTIREKAEDGSPPEIGPFRRHILVHLEGESMDPETVMLEGTILGDVYVGNGNEGGKVRLGLFRRDKGTTKTIQVWTQTPGTTLAVDTARTAGFLNVQLPAEPEKSSDGRQVWKMKVAVRPDQVRGKFPREEDPIVRDSAIYLRLGGSTPRTMRIPVEGRAEEK